VSFRVMVSVRVRDR